VSRPMPPARPLGAGRRGGRSDASACGDHHAGARLRCPGSPRREARHPRDALARFVTRAHVDLDAESSGGRRVGACGASAEAVSPLHGSRRPASAVSPPTRRTD
jgi:hypothetical protein